jgi:hypothetical protein
MKDNTPVWIYFHGEGCIKEQSGMPEPDQNKFYQYDSIDPSNPDKIGFDMDGFNNYCYDYQQHELSRQTYPIVLSPELDGKEVQEGEHFKFEKQTHVEVNLNIGPVWESASDQEYFNEDEGYRRIVSVPIASPDKREGQEEKDENGLLPCPFCGGKVLLKQIGINKLEIKCPKCIVTYIQKTLRYDCEWLLGKMQETWNRRAIAPASPMNETPVEETSKEYILGLYVANNYAAKPGWVLISDALLAMEEYKASRTPVEEGKEDAIAKNKKI